MKKILILFSTLLLAASCEWFEFDNQEGYNAQVEGRFLDSKTGQPLQFGYPNSSTFTIIEEGWDGEVTQAWYVRPNGTYVNKLTFEGDYRIQTLNSNYYPLTEKFSLKKGGNTLDFTVTPYARVLDPKIRYDAGTKQLIATFKVEHADPSKTKNMLVAFLGFTDRFVSDGFNNFTATTAKQTAGVFADGVTEISLFVDVSDKAANNAQFKYNRVHYVRIGALATGTGVNSSYRYNFSPVYEVSSDFQTIQEITNWTED